MLQNPLSANQGGACVPSGPKGRRSPELKQIRGAEGLEPGHHHKSSGSEEAILYQQSHVSASHHREPPRHGAARSFRDDPLGCQRLLQSALPCVHRGRRTPTSLRSLPAICRDL
ncbi:hypothetical protein Q8A67_021827 [Cirrhinus molitorella]|uniref:Uncharacterized protein n=1 Tax=Cirrhinus molitorella TaxID=172907 RepID=A0AA88TCB2_9TELE|nr:hypothetical protein Q8A67_021827 [Cirrhinus molitorella]